MRRLGLGTRHVLYGGVSEPQTGSSQVEATPCERSHAPVASDRQVERLDDDGAPPEKEYACIQAAELYGWAYATPHSLNQFPPCSIASCRYRDVAKPRLCRIACCHAEKGVSRGTMSSPAPVVRMVSDTSGNACRSRSAVGVSVSVFPCCECHPARWV